MRQNDTVFTTIRPNNDVLKRRIRRTWRHRSKRYSCRYTRILCIIFGLYFSRIHGSVKYLEMIKRPDNALSVPASAIKTRDLISCISHTIIKGCCRECSRTSFHTIHIHLADSTRRIIRTDYMCPCARRDRIWTRIYTTHCTILHYPQNRIATVRAIGIKFEWTPIFTRCSII